MTAGQSRELLTRKLDLVLPNLAAKDRDFVLDAYSESWRTYHNADHILKMFRLLDSTPTANFLSSSETLALHCMIIYHDVVYKLYPEEGWNECQSACIAIVHLTEAGLPIEIGRTVGAGIYTTITHTLDALDESPPDSDIMRVPIAYLLDLDLAAGLGRSWEEFSANTELVWQEYQPVATREQFDLGRIAWAKSFLQRPKIFHTEQFAHLEDPVRDNLRRLAATE